MKINKYIVYAVIVVVIVSVAAFVMYQKWLDNNAALVVGDIRVSKVEYNKLKDLANKEGVKDDEFKQQLIDVNKYTYAAKKADIAIEASMLSSANVSSALYPEKYDVSNNWQLGNVHKAYIQREVYSLENGSQEVAIMYFPFSRFFARGYETPPKDFGNADLINQNKTYAKAKAEQIKKDLVAGKISLDQALKDVTNDKQLIFGYAPNGSIKLLVTNERAVVNLDGTKAQLSPQEYTKLTKMKEKTASQIYTMESADIGAAPGYDKGTIEYGYYFYYLAAKHDKDRAKYDTFKRYLDGVAIRLNV